MNRLYIFQGIEGRWEGQLILVHATNLTLAEAAMHAEMGIKGYQYIHRGSSPAIIPLGEHVTWTLVEPLSLWRELGLALLEFRLPRFKRWKRYYR